MFGFIVKHTIRNCEDVTSTKGRGRYGRLGSITGICVNILLSSAKFLAGTLAGSVSVIGDAINNLFDAGSSVISFISFRLSGKPADREHPYGHARLEYLLSTLVSVVILYVAVELIKTSVVKIINPEPSQFNLLTACVLLGSIGAKLWLNRFYTYLEKKIGSAMLKAVALDSLSDVMATSAVLVSAVISPLIGVQLDGYMGIVIALFIAYSGIKILIEMMNSLVGKTPPEETVRRVSRYILGHEGIIGLHDLILHDYGPGRCFATAHVEVDAKHDILLSHDMIDNIERNIAKDMKIQLVIHLDPVVTDDPEVTELKCLAEEVVRGVDAKLTLHDFRVVRGATHSNLIFDVVAPFQQREEDERILEEIKAGIQNKRQNLYPVITLDHSFIEQRIGEK